MGPGAIKLSKIGLQVLELNANTLVILVSTMVKLIPDRF